MIPPKFRVFLWLGPIVALNWIALATMDPDVPQPLFLGFFFGSMFAQTSVAAAWTILGPLRHMYRVPLALLWLALLVFAVWVNIAVNNGPQGAEALVGACLLGVFMVICLVLGIPKLAYGLQLRHAGEQPSGSGEAQFQFGIRQLFVVTSIFAVILGVGRFALPGMSDFLQRRGMDEGPIFAFLGIAAVLVTVPLMIASLLRRWALAGLAITLALVALATWWEVSLARALRIDGPDSQDFIALNFATTVILLILLLPVRANGYCLAASRRGFPATE